MIQISHLVVNGCSWTYGDELTDPVNQSWAGLLSQHLKLPIVNLADRGHSNPAIFRRTAEYLFKNSSTGSKPFVIVAWTQNARDEGWFEYCKGYRTIRSPDVIKNLQPKEKGWLHDFNIEDHFRRSLLHKVNMINLLTALDIPFIIGNYENSDNDFFQKDDVNGTKTLFKEMLDYVNNHPNVWKTPLIDFAKDCKKMPNGHEGPDGHQMIFEQVLKFFKEVYPKYNFVNSLYLDTKTYNTVFKEAKLNDLNPWEF